MKNVWKVTMILIILISLVFSTNYCYATKKLNGEEVEEVDEQTQQTTEESTERSNKIFDPNKIEKPNSKESKELEKKAGIIIGVIRAVGIAVAVIALMVIGVRTLIGSAEQKSHYKESLPGYIVGFVMVVAITLLPTIIYELVKDW